ncbi:MAG: hypothetical protein RJQ09_21225 [Cyclobacteriaceae bacterium]
MIDLKWFLNGTELQLPPLDWEEFIPSLQRDKVYRTVLKKFSLERLNFVKDGKSLIDAAYLADGTEAAMTLLVQRKDYNDYTFKDWFGGELLFASYKWGDTSSSVGFSMSGLFTTWKNRDDMEVNLNSLVDLDGNAITAFANETIEMDLPGQPIDKDYHTNKVHEDATILTISPGVETEIYAEPVFWFQFTPEDELVTEVVMQNFNIPTLFTEIQPTENYEFNEPGDITFRFNFNIIIQLGVGATGYTLDNAPFIRLVLKHKNTVYQIATNNLLPASSAGQEHSYLVAVNDDTTINDWKPGDQVSIYIEFQNCTEGSDPPIIQMKMEGTDFGIGDNTSTESYDYDLLVTQNTTVPDSTSKMMPVYECFMRSFQQITGLADPIRSEWYGRTDTPVHTYASNGAGSLRFNSNGSWIRGFEPSEKPLNISLKDLYSAFNSLDNIGIGQLFIGGVEYIVIENIEYFFNPANKLFDIEVDPRHISIEPNDLVFNELRFGNRTWESEQFGSLDTPHSKRTYATGIKQVKRQYNFENEGITSGIDFELTRRDEKKAGEQKDNRRDSKLFILQGREAGGGGYEVDLDEDFSAINNILNSATRYNMKLTPVRTLLRHASWFKSGLTKITDKQIRFASGEANYDAETQLTGGSLLSESQHFDYDDLDDPLLTGNEINVNENYLTDEQVSQALDNPNGWIGVTAGDDYYKGFIQDMNIKDSLGNEAPLKLLEMYEAV